MNKQPDNNDFQDLFQIYTESCGYNKDEEKKIEDDEEEELATEEAEEAEEAKEVQEEGLFDRIKAKGSALKAGAKTLKGNFDHDMKHGVGAKVKHGLMGGEEPTMKKRKPKDVRGRYDDKQAHSILNSHVIKLDKALSGLASDVVKLGVMDADQAEELAENISVQIRKSFIKRTKGQGFSAKGQNFRHD